MSVTTVGSIPCDRFVVRFSYFLPYPLLLSAAYLMAARAVAIWSRALWVIIATTLGLVAYLSAIIYATIVLRVGSIRLPGEIAYACVDLGPNHATGIKVSITTTYTVDFLCLVLIFAGLWRHHRVARKSGLLSLLWTQSLVLLVVAVALTGIPLLILVWAEVNGAILAMGLAVGYVLVGVGTTRMTRGLYNTQLAPSDSAPTPGGSVLAPELTTISVPESSYTNLSSLAFSRPRDKAGSLGSYEMSSTCASSSNRRGSLP
ncbi:unnamed protein product [Peniophora sp. CBMAI 1063]|nr:unnamed protein product [Peniophora sp. CBMAI 1063]